MTPFPMCNSAKGDLISQETLVPHEICRFWYSIFRYTRQNLMRVESWTQPQRILEVFIQNVSHPKTKMYFAGVIKSQCAVVEEEQRFKTLSRFDSVWYEKSISFPSLNAVLSQCNNFVWVIQASFSKIVN